jgi:hypothetical protein
LARRPSRNAMSSASPGEERPARASSLSCRRSASEATLNATEPIRMAVARSASAAAGSGKPKSDDASHALEVCSGLHQFRTDPDRFPAVGRRGSSCGRPRAVRPAPPERRPGSGSCRLSAPRRGWSGAGPRLRGTRSRVAARQRVASLERFRRVAPTLAPSVAPAQATCQYDPLGRRVEAGNAGDGVMAGIPSTSPERGASSGVTRGGPLQAGGVSPRPGSGTLPPSSDGATSRLLPEGRSAAPCGVRLHAK